MRSTAFASGGRSRFCGFAILSILLLLGLALFTGGCGGGDSEGEVEVGRQGDPEREIDVRRAGDPAKEIDKGEESDPEEGLDVDRLVLKTRDLPGVEDIEKPFPELCGPVAVLEKEGGRAALSQRFVFRDGEAAEAAAIFRTEERARSAVGALNEMERLRCIGESIALFAPPQVSIDFKRPAPLDVGEEATVTRYRLLDRSAGREGYSNVVVLRVGRCTASLLIGAEDEAMLTRRTRSASAIAAGLLRRPCR